MTRRPPVHGWLACLLPLALVAGEPPPVAYGPGRELGRLANDAKGNPGGSLDNGGHFVML